MTVKEDLPVLHEFEGQQGKYGDAGEKQGQNMDDIGQSPQYVTESLADLQRKSSLKICSCTW